MDHDGRKVYLHAQWCDAGDGDIIFEANYESIYDAYARLYDADDDDGAFDAALEERDRIDSEGIKDDDCHKSFYAELKRMILDGVPLCSIQLSVPYLEILFEVVIEYILLVAIAYSRIFYPAALKSTRVSVCSEKDLF